MNISEYIELMKLIQHNLLNFLEEEQPQNEEEKSQNLFKQLIDQKISLNQHKLKTLLYIISNISNNHYRNAHFFEKIEKILLFFIKEIKQYYTNYDIFKIFKNSKRILLFLFTESILSIDPIIQKIILEEKYKSRNYLYYLFTENCVAYGLIQKVDNNFSEKRRIGENDDYICQLIRQDLIEEFITYVNKNDYPLNSIVKKSIYETNLLLLKQGLTTLIEYAAFFGSVQIFKYLYKNNVILSPILWIYAIHGNDPEIISILEENRIPPPKYSYEICIKEAIKCNHNNIVNYIISNLLEEDNAIINLDSYSFHYYNFINFPNEIDNQLVFNYSCKYDYFPIVEYFLKTKAINENKKNYLNTAAIRNAADSNNQEILDLLIKSGMLRIADDCFKECKKLLQIKIPSTVTYIGKNAFYRCTLLYQITIPNSVKSIGNNAFYGFTSNSQITIPSSVTSIEKLCFSCCSSLSQIIIPLSVTLIGYSAFYDCLSLAQIIIPSSVTVIGPYAFSKCISLEKIVIPSSVIKILKVLLRVADLYLMCQSLLL